MISYSECYCLFKQYIMLSSISLKLCLYLYFYFRLPTDIFAQKMLPMIHQVGARTIFNILYHKWQCLGQFTIGIISDMKIGVDNKQHHVLSCHLDLIPSLERALFNTVRSKVTSQYIMIWNDSRILAFFHLWIDFSHIIQIHIVIVWS